MDKTTLNKLRAAHAALGKAIAALETAEEEGTRYEVGHCNICGQPIYSDQATKRQRHATCYHEIYDAKVKTGQATLEELEQAGIIGPKRRPGPQKKTEDTSDTLARVNAALRRHRQQQKDDIERNTGN